MPPTPEYSHVIVCVSDTNPAEVTKSYWASKERYDCTVEIARAYAEGFTDASSTDSLSVYAAPIGGEFEEV